LPFLKATIRKSKDEVNGMCKIFELYEIEEGARILDFSCGIGRHTIELSMRNFRVVGYDPSELYIEYARNWAERVARKKDRTPEFYCGHPLKISEFLLNRKFDGAIAMGSLGFLNESFDISILRNLAKVVKQKSILILELENRDWTLRNFQKYTHERSDDLELFEEWEYDSETSVSKSITNFWRVKSEKDLSLMLQLNTTLRLYSLHEIVKMLKAAGWKYLTSYDSILNLEPVNHQSRDMIVVARKERLG
jgi:SAM-dependent methyltransferase